MVEHKHAVFREELVFHALEKLTDVLGVEHHITLAHCPWANGSVEVAGRELIRTIKALLSEMRLPLEKWEAVVPLVQFVLNHLLRKSLGMRCPIEIMTGQRPKDAVDLTLYLGKLLKNST